jgi:LAO/AO transport system kinase
MSDGQNKTGRRPATLPVNDYVSGILAGDRTLLSRAITLVESELPAHQETARSIIEACLPHSGKSIRIGITGVPGVGKSTFIEALGKHITAEDHQLAVLAIDPSSQQTGGSILGDKTRMEALASDPKAYIRPTPSRGSLGGVARKTRETILLCEAAGFDVIFIETVGVGQSEIAVHSMVDFFLLLMLAGAGDELQGIKRGIMEMADAIAITKTDGDNIGASNSARLEYKNALHLFPPTKTGWIPRAETCSSYTGTGINKIWDIIQEHHLLVKTKGFFAEKRNEQARFWMHETISEELKNRFYNNPEMVKKIEAVEADVLSGKISPSAAAQLLLNS